MAVGDEAVMGEVLKHPGHDLVDDVLDWVFYDFVLNYG